MKKTLFFLVAFTIAALAAIFCCEQSEIQTDTIRIQPTKSNYTLTANQEGVTLKSYDVLNFQQYFQIIPQDDQRFIIKNPFTEKVLQVDAAGSGNSISLGDFNASTNQLWMLSLDDEGAHIHSALDSNYVLDIYGNSNDAYQDDTKVWLFEKLSGTSDYIRQSWQIKNTINIGSVNKYSVSLFILSFLVALVLTKLLI